MGVSIPSNGSIQFLHSICMLAGTILLCVVSIPSNGSIQFLRFGGLKWRRLWTVMVSIPSNGSIQFLLKMYFQEFLDILEKSQSPQTGQFNSYKRELSTSFDKLPRLNPLKRVNSILTRLTRNNKSWARCSSQSPQTGQFNSYFHRVCVRLLGKSSKVSIPSNGSIQFLLEIMVSKK